MIATRFLNANVEFARPERWTREQCYDLWGFRGEIPGFKGNYADDARTPVVATAWRPTPEELVKINLGEPIFVLLCSDVLPPMIVMVQDPWEGPTENADTSDTEA